MLKVNCDACGAPFEVDPHHIPKAGLNTACPACGASVYVMSSADPGEMGDSLQLSGRGFDIDLPVVKPQASGAKKHKGTHLGLGMPLPAAAPKPSPAFPSAAAVLDEFADLPAPTGDLPRLKVPGDAGQGRAELPDFDVPASGQSPFAMHDEFAGGFASSDQGGFGASFDDADLPAAKPSANATKRIAPSFDSPPSSALPGLGAGSRVPSEAKKSQNTQELTPAAKKSTADWPPAPKKKSDVPPEKKNTQDLTPAAKKSTADWPPAPKKKSDVPPAKKNTQDLTPAAKKSTADWPPAPKKSTQDLAPGAKRATADFAPPGLSGEGAGPRRRPTADYAPVPNDSADLPAAKGYEDLPARSSMNVDLPTPKGITDLPAPAGYEFDVPALREGGAHGARGGRAALPKDSLAIDPAPFYAGGNAAGPLGDLDDLEPRVGRGTGAFEERRTGVPDERRTGSFETRGTGAHDNLPAPSNLPVAKTTKGGGKAATVLGLGNNRLAKDSLDMPGGAQGYGAPAIVTGYGDHDDLPAPADLPTLKGEGSYDGGLDLPAPNDLPARRNTAPGAGGTAMGIGSGMGLDASPDQRPYTAGARHSTDMGLGQVMLDGPLDLPPSTPANETGRNTGTFGPFDLPSMGSTGALDFGQSLAGFAPSGFEQNEDTNAFARGGFDVGLDLPPAGMSGDDGSLIDLSKLALPAMEGGSLSGGPSFNSTMDLSGDDLMGNGRVTKGTGPLPLPTMGDIDLFGEGPSSSSMNNAPRGQTIELDGMFDLGASLAVEPIAPRNAGRGAPPPPTGAFGELDFGLKGDGGSVAMPMPMPQPIPQGGGGHEPNSVEAELLGGDGAISAPKGKKKKISSPGKAIPAWVWPVVMLLVIAGTGVSLGLFTPHGYFGVYLMEQFLPAAGDPVRVAAAIVQAEKQARSDTYLDVRKALVVLSDARNEAGLSRELLARSLLHEALYQLRFGEDAQSSQRSVAILARVMERGVDVKGLTIARAADAARRGELKEARTLLQQSPLDGDPYRALVAGEIALLEKKFPEAEKEFTKAKPTGARAMWGFARALIGEEKLPEAERAAHATLELSPRHSAANAFLAELALNRNDYKTAIDFTGKAIGSIPVEGLLARPSRMDTTRGWALMGKIEEKLEHPREAQVAYERALAADPLRVEVLIGSGRMLMRLGRARDALARFDSALGAKPSEKPGADGRVPLLDATVGAAQALLAIERNTDAFMRVTNIEAKYPESSEVQLWKGYALLAQEKVDEAEEAFHKSIDSDPKRFPGYVALSQLLFKRGRPEDAAKVLVDATGKVEDSAEVRRMLGNSELARNHLPEAIHQFEAALRFDAKDSGALFGLVMAQRKTGHLESAAKYLEKLEKADPSFPGLPLERGQLLESQGHYEEAISIYRKAIEERPQDTELRLRLGAALVTAGHIDDADAILKQVLKERPSSAEAEHFVGRILFARKETAQAVQRFERAVSFDPTHAEYHMFLAWALLEQNNLSGALEAVNKAIERDPNLGDAHWILGRIQLRTGAVKDALESFEKTRRLKPGRIEALAGMGDAYDELRELGEAVQAYKEATRLQPENGEWWFRLGSLHLDRGKLDEARVALQEAVLRGDRLFDKPRWLADAHRVYADLLRQGGRAGEALEHYKLFLSLAPADHPDRREIQEIVKSSEH